MKTILELLSMRANGKLDDCSMEELQALEKHLIVSKLADEDTIDVDEAYYKAHPERAPKDKITSSGESKAVGNDAVMQKFYNGYWQRHATIETASGYEHKSEDSKKEPRFQVYADQRYQEWGMAGMWTNTDSDTGCEDIVTSWSPADTYAKVVWETFVCKADLLDICVKGIAVNPGEGLTVQVRAYGAFGAPSAKNACECASCASITFKTYPVTVAQYNLEAIICGLDEFDVGSALLDAYLKSMADSWAKYFDQEIYDALEEASPGTTETLGLALVCDAGELGSSCCTDSSLMNLTNSINRGVAAMREGASPYNPDWILISPSVAEIFKRFQTPKSGFFSKSIVFDENGRLKRIAGLKVKEYCGANPCAATGSEVMAIIIDSRRAVAGVFGQRPKLYRFFQSNCNSTRLDNWAYWGVAAMDLDAICHIINP